MSNSLPDNAIAPSFKGIALFTPGGDCVYCIDEQKRAHWHLDLCATLQGHLGLVEPPYFLLPGFTATVDRWISPATQRLELVAEAYPRALRYQPLLNVLFGLGQLQWQPNYSGAEECSVALIESYRSMFPQLWDCHDLVIRLESTPPVAAQPHRFQLFISGADTTATEQLLRLLYKALETHLPGAYSLQVIDVATHPAEAEAAHISATPTLIQTYPERRRRLVGQVANQEQMMQLLATG